MHGREGRRVALKGGGGGDEDTGERQKKNETEKYMDECIEEEKTKRATNKGCAVDLEGVD